MLHLVLRIMVDIVKAIEHVSLVLIYVTSIVKTVSTINALVDVGVISAEICKVSIIRGIRVVLKDVKRNKVEIMHLDVLVVIINVSVVFMG